MNKTEAKKRIEAAERELAAAKAALEQAHAEPDGRVIMKPSEVPVGEYFKFVDPMYHGDFLCWKTRPSAFHSAGKPNRSGYDAGVHDDEPVYLTDPYGNAIEPCEKLPEPFFVDRATESIRKNRLVLGVFDWNYAKEGHKFWSRQYDCDTLSPSAAAKLRGMIHKWNQENGGQG